MKATAIIMLLRASLVPLFLNIVVDAVGIPWLANIVGELSITV